MLKEERATIMKNPYTLHIVLEGKEKIYKRKVYSFLDMLGNIGGLFDGLLILMGFIFNFYNAIMFELSLGKSLFKFHKTPAKKT